MPLADGRSGCGDAGLRVYGRVAWVPMGDACAYVPRGRRGRRGACYGAEGGGEHAVWLGTGRSGAARSLCRVPSVQRGFRHIAWVSAPSVGFAKRGFRHPACVPSPFAAGGLSCSRRRPHHAQTRPSPPTPPPPHAFPPLATRHLRSPLPSLFFSDPALAAPFRPWFIAGWLPCQRRRHHHPRLL